MAPKKAAAAPDGGDKPKDGVTLALFIRATFIEESPAAAAKCRLAFLNDSHECGALSSFEAVQPSQEDADETHEEAEGAEPAAASITCEFKKALPAMVVDEGKAAELAEAFLGFQLVLSEEGGERVIDEGMKVFAGPLLLAKGSAPDEGKDEDQGEEQEKGDMPLGERKGAVRSRPAQKTYLTEQVQGLVDIEYGICIEHPFDGPVLPPELHERLNPVLITIHTAHHLPLPSAKQDLPLLQQQANGAVPHSLDLWQPPHAVVTDPPMGFPETRLRTEGGRFTDPLFKTGQPTLHFPINRPSPPKGSPRSHLPVPSGSVVWEHGAIMFWGPERIDQHRLREELAMRTMRVEIYDRTPVPPPPPVDEEADEAEEEAPPPPVVEKGKAKGKAAPPPPPDKKAKKGKDKNHEPPPPVQQETKKETQPATNELPKISSHGLACVSLRPVLNPKVTQVKLRADIVPHRGNAKQRAQKGIFQGMATPFLLHDPSKTLKQVAGAAREREFAPPYLQNGSFLTLSIQLMHPLKTALQLDARETTADEETRGEEGQEGDEEEEEEEEGDEEGEEKQVEIKAEEPPLPPLLNATIRAAPKLEAAFERFNRAVFILDGRKTTIMRKILGFVAAQNAVAMGLSEGPSRALAVRQLTEEERSSPDLDIITGFVLLDRSTRLVVLEGLRSKALYRLMTEELPRDRPNRQKYTVLYNSEIGFSSRRYAAFDLQLKHLKIRGTLERLMRKPQIYDRKTAEAETIFETLQALCDLKRCDRIHAAKQNHLFPSVDALLLVQSNYGDFVSDNELQGGYDEPETQSVHGGAATAYMQSPRSPHSTVYGGGGPMSEISRRSPRKSVVSRSPREEEMDSDADQEGGEAETLTVKHKIRWKAPTESHNPTYEAHLERRKAEVPADVIERHRQDVAEMSSANAARWPAKEEPDLSFLEGREVFLYSSQKLNSGELQRDALRKRFQKKDKETLWTYSPEYNTQSFGMVDWKGLTFRDDVPGKVPHKLAWRFPKARPPQAFRQPPRDISDARRHELSTSWEENEWRAELQPPSQQRGAPFSVNTTESIPPHQPFGPSTIMWDEGHLFGPTSLFRSVHHPVDSLRGVQPAVKKGDEQQEPRPPMRMLLRQQLPSAADRFEGARKGPPEKTGLRFDLRRPPRALEKRFGVTGMHAPLEMPDREEPSILAKEPFEDPGGFDRTLRRSKKDSPHPWETLPRMPSPFLDPDVYDIVLSRPPHARGEEEQHFMTGTSLAAVADRDFDLYKPPKRTVLHKGPAAGRGPVTDEEKAWHPARWNLVTSEAA
ncbi:unnamed protein product [Vitrella brassicaformis CCMP3155]|uniref:Uncharacterized protein n=3 Tax=Vitrella brassicaformis TaxID=1169539 RepID=A0A0G4EYR9_VITBC|nr:unnamed protein product [Vitrella brassicaformis CCMP3155]|eukprot:CEM04086.1 unnamed protein product [Vitrella brassicaformis CCMP3155]